MVSVKVLKILYAVIGMLYWLAKKVRKKFLEKSFEKKNFRKKILKKNFAKTNLEKSFNKKSFGIINYKRKIFITKIYSSIDKCHTIFALLASFERTG